MNPISISRFSRLLLIHFMFISCIFNFIKAFQDMYAFLDTLGIELPWPIIVIYEYHGLI